MNDDWPTVMSAVSSGCVPVGPSNGSTVNGAPVWLSTVKVTNDASAPVSVLEGDPADFTPVFSNPSEVAIPYPVVVTPITGDDDDVFPLVTTVNFGSSVLLNTIENEIPEGDETFSVAIGGVPATLTILEDDQFGFGITLVGPEQPVVEGSEAEFVLKFPTPTPKGVSFDWDVSVDPDDLPEGASPADTVNDLELPAIQRVDVHPTETEVRLRVPITVDSTPEPQESFALTVELDGMVIPLKATANIVDPDLCLLYTSPSPRDS